MPGYGISDDSKGMLSWDWAEARMAKSRNYWVCTTRPGGRPHASPVWGVWMDWKESEFLTSPTRWRFER